MNDWLEAKGVKGGCLCGQREWLVARPTFVPFLDEHFLTDGTGMSYLLVLLYCPNCGFTLLFNGCVMELNPLPVTDAGEASGPM